MHHRKFVAKIDSGRIEAAIRRAEAGTSGEICVMIHHQPVDDAVAFAQAEFVRRGLQQTRERNAVLIFVAPASRNFAVIGDEAVHRKCGDAFWTELAAAMSEHFKAGRFTEGLLHGVDTAGSLLARHFPPQPDNPNELPDRVIRS